MPPSGHVPAGEYEVMKRAAARRACELVEPGSVIGVGSGSTVDAFVDELVASGVELAAAVAASGATAVNLSGAGYLVVTLEEVELPLGLYVDGADAVDHLGRALKGGGGAHGGEKVLAYASTTWACIVDETKLRRSLAEVALPVPLEVLQDTIPLVARMVHELGAAVEPRGTFRTDHGNPILDVHGLDLSDPEALELALDALPGVVECGIFARRCADLIVVGLPDGTASVCDPGRGDDWESGA